MTIKWILTKQEAEKLERLLMFAAREHPLEKVRRQAGKFLDFIQSELVEQLTLDEK